MNLRNPSRVYNKRRIKDNALMLFMNWIESSNEETMRIDEDENDFSFLWDILEID